VPPLTGTLHGAATRMVGPAPASLVPSAAIMRLPDLQGYLTSQHLVIRVRLASVDPEPVHRAALPRPMTTLEVGPCDPPPAAGTSPDPDRAAAPAIDIFE